MNTEIKGLLELQTNAIWQMKPVLCMATAMVLLLLLVVIIPKSRQQIPAMFVFFIGFVLGPIALLDFDFSSILSSIELVLYCSVLLFGIQSWYYHKKTINVEYLFLSGSIVLGSYVLLYAQNYLIAVLGLELMSLPAYLLTAWKLNKKSTEAAMKYFIYGAFSTAILLYGVSWYYGGSGTTNISVSAIAQLLNAQGGIAFSIFAFVLILIGVSYKVSAVPMHFWTPDVYQEAPTPIVSLFSVVPKLAGFVFFLRLVLTVVDSPLQTPVFYTIAAVLLASITIGNFSALRQKNVKRMLAYSTIAHSGFILIPLLTPVKGAIEHFFFYLIVYAIMNVAAFLFIDYYESRADVRSIEDFKGKGKNNALVGVLFLIVLVSLTGLPPTGGFMAKLFVLTDAFQLFQKSESLFVLFILLWAVLNTVISLYYYLQIPYYMYLKKWEEKSVMKIKFDPVVNFLGLILVFLITVSFFMPTWLMGLINNVNFAQ